jgi:hypothetical protein
MVSLAILNSVCLSTEEKTNHAAFVKLPFLIKCSHKEPPIGAVNARSDKERNRDFKSRLQRC